MVIEYIAALNSSIELAKHLREISKDIQNAEFKQVLADLYNELGDVKLAMADLKELVADLKEENLRLKTMQPENKEKPVLFMGGYKFEGEDGVFCTGCYDSAGKKIQTVKTLNRMRSCPVCNNTFKVS